MKPNKGKPSIVCSGKLNPAEFCLKCAGLSLPEQTMDGFPLLDLGLVVEAEFS